MTTEQKKINIKLILFVIMLVSVGLVLTFSYIIFDEIYSAKKNCEEINGNYKLKSMQHLCNNKSFYKYSDGTWDFSKELSWNDTVTIKYPK